MTEEKRAEAIDAIRRRFRDEWLLIAIEEIDRLTTIPLRGRLIAHSPTRGPLASQLLNVHDGSCVPKESPQRATYDPRRTTALRPLYYLTRSDHRLPARHASAF